MTIYDEQYNAMINDILENGVQDEPSAVRAKWKDGSPATTISLLNQKITFENRQDQSGLMTTKFVSVKNLYNEIRWIWQMKSNVVQKLRDLKCNIWNEWENEDGTIGLAYGAQLRNKKREMRVDTLMYDMIQNKEILHEGIVWIKGRSVLGEKIVQYYAKDIAIGDTVMLDQVDWLLYNLKHPTRKYSRRLIVTLWCFEDLDYMSLEPCVYLTHWQMWGGKLHLTVSIRSNDLSLGNPYNTPQYAILHRMIAQVTGNEVGTITFNIDNAHIYERHIEGLKEQIARPVKKDAIVTLNSNIKSFYDFGEDDIRVLGYDYSGKSRFEVAI